MIKTDLASSHILEKQRCEINTKGKGVGDRKKERKKGKYEKNIKDPGINVADQMDMELG
jgi:stalled ribosome alternative rescue factor ArfA